MKENKGRRFVTGNEEEEKGKKKEKNRVVPRCEINSDHLWILPRVDENGSRRRTSGNSFFCYIFGA